jgi:hypothetical protein
MNKPRKIRRLLHSGLLELVASLLVVSVTLGASSTNYAINFAQVGAAGSEVSQSSSYHLNATLGQGLGGDGLSASFHAHIGYRFGLGPAGTPLPTATLGPPTPTYTPAPPTATPPCTIPFVDITGNVFYGAIVYLYCGHVVNGTDSTHYSPAGTSTRGQFAKVVVLGFGTPFYTPGLQDFSDVSATYFAYLYIESGFHAGVLSGFDQNTCSSNHQPYPCYLPNRPITRGQLTKLVVNAAHYQLYTPSGGQPTFTDVPPSNVFFISIETAAHKSVVSGYANHTFRPNNNIRRDEMAQIVFKGVTTP